MAKEKNAPTGDDKMLKDAENKGNENAAQKGDDLMKQPEKSTAKEKQIRVHVIRNVHDTETNQVFPCTITYKGTKEILENKKAVMVPVSVYNRLKKHMKVAE